MAMKQNRFNIEEIYISFAIMKELSMIEKFVNEKTSNPELMHQLFDYSLPVFSLKQKLSSLQQQISSINEQKQKKNCQLNQILKSLEDLQKNNSELASIDQQIYHISQEEKLRQQKTEQRYIDVKKQKEKLLEMIENERKKIQLQIQRKKQSQISKRRENKNLMQTLNERQKKVQQNLQRKQYMQKIKNKNSNLTEAIDENQQEYKKMKRKQIEELTNFREKMQIKVKEQNQLKNKSLGKLNEFVKELNQIVQKGDEKVLYELSAKYIESYELTYAQMQKKHQSSETKDDQTEILDEQLTKLQQKNHKLKSIGIDKTKLSKFSDQQMMDLWKRGNVTAKEKRESLRSQVRQLEDKLQSLVKEESEADEYIDDLKRRSEQKQSQILALGILKMHKKP